MSDLKAQVFDTSNLSPAEKQQLREFAAARIGGAPIKDPPSAGVLLREDTPFYIALAFPKIFQTGAADFWAYAEERKCNGCQVTLLEWFQHVLRHRSGRALKHPRFYYFAVNTVLRNKAVRRKSYFVKRQYEGEAFEEFTPEQLLKMSKQHMAKIITAYEQAMPGSAAEKLQQRSNLESMINQLETESFIKAYDDLQHVAQKLEDLIHVANATSMPEHDALRQLVKEAHGEASIVAQITEHPRYIPHMNQASTEFVGHGQTLQSDLRETIRYLVGIS
jgi:hypothetical protein